MNPNQQPQDFNNPSQPMQEPASPQFGAQPQPFDAPEAPAPTPSSFPQPEAQPQPVVEAVPVSEAPTPSEEATPSMQSAESQPFGEPAAPTANAFAQPDTAPQNQSPVTSGTDPGHTLGIISIVLSFVGLSVVGIILGVISRNKSREAGAPGTLGKIGIILGAVFTVLGLVVAGLLIAAFAAAINAAV